MYGRACGSVDPGGGSGEAGAGGVSEPVPGGEPQPGGAASLGAGRGLPPEMVGENPKTLTEAYRSWQEAEKDREIAELRAQLAAQAQNQENRAASPSSQSDSGAPQAAGPYDQFLSAYTG